MVLITENLIILVLYWLPPFALIVNEAKYSPTVEIFNIIDEQAEEVFGGYGHNG